MTESGFSASIRLISSSDLPLGSSLSEVLNLLAKKQYHQRLPTCSSIRKIVMALTKSQNSVIRRATSFTGTFRLWWRMSACGFICSQFYTPTAGFENMYWVMYFRYGILQYDRGIYTVFCLLWGQHETMMLPPCRTKSITGRQHGCGMYTFTCIFIHEYMWNTYRYLHALLPVPVPGTLQDVVHMVYRCQVTKNNMVPVKNCLRPLWTA